MSISNLTPAQLRQAASILEEIEQLQNQLNQLNDGVAVAPVAAPAAAPADATPGRKRRKMSAAGLARIRAAQKLRWAKVHAAKGK